jgi:hypothetical protein
MRQPDVSGCRSTTTTYYMPGATKSEYDGKRADVLGTLHPIWVKCILKAYRQFLTSKECMYL